MATDKLPTPPYGSFKSFLAFFNARRDDGHITDVVDRSLMTSFSGSSQKELLGCLKFLRMIDDKGKPTPLYEQFVIATDESRKALLAATLRTCYPFLFSVPPYNLERATTTTTADAFRTQGINGSTLSRAVAFFLSAAKEAGIKVSPNIKVPPLLKTPILKRQPKAAVASGNEEAEGDEQEDEDDLLPDGFQLFEIPIPINRKVRIMIPDKWTAADWDLFQTMLSAYVTGWKAVASKAPTGPKKEEDK